MVNGGDVFICVLVGLALPLAVLDGYRSVCGQTLEARFAGPGSGGRSLAWLFTLMVGPGLFVEKMLAAWRDGALSAADQANALVIACGWAALHGFVVLSVVRMLLPA